MAEDPSSRGALHSDIRSLIISICPADANDFCSKVVDHLAEKDPHSLSTCVERLQEQLEEGTIANISRWMWEQDPSLMRKTSLLQRANDFDRDQNGEQDSCSGFCLHAEAKAVAAEEQKTEDEKVVPIFKPQSQNHSQADAGNRVVGLRRVVVQISALVLFVGMSANDSIVKSWSKERIHGEDKPSVFPYSVPSVVLMSSLSSIVVSLSCAAMQGDSNARRRTIASCLEPSAIIRMAPVSILFSFAQILKFKALLYMPPDFVIILDQMQLSLLAVASCVIMRRSYSAVHLMALFMVSMCTVQYIGLRREQQNPKNPAMPLDISSALVIGSCLMFLIAVASSLIAKKSHRAVQLIAVSMVAISSWLALTQSHKSDSVRLHLSQIFVAEPQHGTPFRISDRLEHLLVGSSLMFLQCIASTVACVFCEYNLKIRDREDMVFYVQKCRLEVTGSLFAMFYCFVIDPWQSGDYRALTGDLFIFTGWGWKTLVVLLIYTVKVWLSTWIAKILDSVVKQVASSAAILVVYMELLLINPSLYSPNVLMALLMVSLSIMSFAVAGGYTERHRASEMALKEEYQQKNQPRAAAHETTSLHSPLLPQG